jgi:hypothetical protein
MNLLRGQQPNVAHTSTQEKAAWSRASTSTATTPLSRLLQADLVFTLNIWMLEQRIEIKIGQGAKPGIGGHLPGEKVTEHVAKTRMIPTGH